MLKIIAKRKNEKIGVVLILDTSPIKRAVKAILVFLSLQARSSTRQVGRTFSVLRQYFYLKLRLFRLILKILRANPETISLQKERENGRFLLSWEEDFHPELGQKLRQVGQKPLKATIKQLKGSFHSACSKLQVVTARTTRRAQERIGRAIAFFTILTLLFQVSMVGFFLPTPALANEMCVVDVDVVLVMDTSGSMAEGEAPSECKWYTFEKVGPSWQWVKHVDYGVTEEWCEGRSHPERFSIYTPAKQSKLDAARDAAKSFINYLESNDQSAMVFFNDEATLAKQLSNDHNATKATIDGLVPEGSTNIGDAIAEGTKELSSERANPQANKVIILLTDGKANRPSGSGYGEDPQDVAYAEQKAQEAANLNYKIFTIGLGSNTEINETMLQNIANITGAKYYHAPDGNGLAAIYDEIAWEVCQYGSISGCKYQDANNNGVINEGEQTLSGWEILLGGNATLSQFTDENGCYTFAGLLEGNYTVTEGENLDKIPFLQTYPEENIHNITLSKGQNVEDVDFANTDSSLCQASEVGRTCLSDGQAEVTLGYNFAFCGQDYTKTETDEECACRLSDTSGDCVAEGLREHSFTWNYAYCGEETTEDVEDSTCDCMALELSRECIADGLATVTYTWNFEYCGEDYTQEEEDLACSSEYECIEWEDVKCVAEGIMEQTRTCTDQYENSTEETRQVSDELCTCVTEEVGRTCLSDGVATIDYSWNYPYCGQDYTETEEDSNCACIETEVSGECVSGTERMYTFTYNFDYCEVREPEIREDPTCAGAPPSEPVCGNGILEEGEECDDGNVEDGDGCSAICEIEEVPVPIIPGDIVINEIMYDPQAVNDTFGEWFELYNTTDKEIDLSGCVIRDKNGDSHTISYLKIGSQYYAVLAFHGNPSFNGGITPDYVYSGMTLDNDNSGDEIILECNEAEIDRVEYDGGLTFPDATGASIILADPALDNNIGAHWCVSTSSFGAGDLGTPGSENDSCEGIIECQATEVSRECVSDGQAEVSYAWNDPSCGEDYTELEEDLSCVEKEPVVGGGGPVFPPSLIIREETIRTTDREETVVTVIWFTNYFATSQVIYAKEGEPHTLDLSDNVGDPPKYGYAHTTPEYDTDPKVTYHSVTITGLNPGTTYYFRAVSHSSLAISQEYTFSTLRPEIEEEIGEEEEVLPKEEITLPEEIVEEVPGEEEEEEIPPEVAGEITEEALPEEEEEIEPEIAVTPPPEEEGLASILVANLGRVWKEMGWPIIRAIIIGLLLGVLVIVGRRGWAIFMAKRREKQEKERQEKLWRP